MFGRFGVYAKDVAEHSVQEAAKGYLLGSVEREGHPVREGLSWGLGTAVLSPTLSGLGKLIGKLGVWGSQEFTDKMMDKAVADYLGKEAHSQVTPVAVAMAGTPEQKLSRALMEAINKETNGAFWKAPQASKQATLKYLAAKYPELAENAGWLDQHLTELQALHETTQWRELMPEADSALKQLEQLSGEPTVKTIANEVAHKEQGQYLQNAPVGAINRIIDKPKLGDTVSATHEQKLKITQDIVDNLKARLEREEAEKSGQAYQTKTKLRAAEERLETLKAKTVPGAASASSLEFGDNFSHHVDQKLNELGFGKDKYVWESRGHKLLFYLNVLASETKLHGPSTERAREAQLLMNQLTQEFPQTDLRGLLAMSDKLWHKISLLEKEGFIKPGVPTRIFRQTHLGPGESPFAHEVDLLQKAAKADAIKAKTAREARQAELKAAKEAKASKVAEAKAKETEKVSKTPTASKEFQSAASQYVAALRKLGYNNEDISKMTPQQLVEIISSKKEKVTEVKAIPIKKELTDDEKLKAAFKKSGDEGTGTKDTAIMRELAKRMFNKELHELDTDELSEISQMAAKASKKGKK